MLFEQRLGGGFGDADGRHRAVREVEDPGAPVDEHDALGGERVDAAETEAERDEGDVEPGMRGNPVRRVLKHRHEASKVVEPEHEEHEAKDALDAVHPDAGLREAEREGADEKEREPEAEGVEEQRNPAADHVAHAKDVIENAHQASGGAGRCDRSGGEADDGAVVVDADATMSATANTFLVGASFGITVNAAKPRAELSGKTRAYVRDAIATAPGFGRGHGPLNHAVTVKA